MALCAKMRFPRKCATSAGIREGEIYSSYFYREFIALGFGNESQIYFPSKLVSS